MADTTKIEWCDHTMNYWEGCMRISPGCDHCYAATMIDTRYGRAKWGGPGEGVGTRRRTSPANWRKAFAWNLAAKAAGETRFVFSSSLSDLYDNAVDPVWRAEAFADQRATPALTYLHLTKRPQNIAKMAAAAGGLPRNAALGASAVNQDEAERIIPILAKLKRDLRPIFIFLSCEPLLGPFDLLRIAQAAEIDWVIVGGESGHGARWMDDQWARDIRDACGVLVHPLFNFKQTGTAPPPGSALKRRANAHIFDGVEYFARPMGVCHGQGSHRETTPVEYAPSSEDGVVRDREHWGPLILARLLANGPMTGRELRLQTSPQTAKELNEHSWALVRLGRLGLLSKDEGGRYSAALKPRFRVIEGGA